MLPSQCLGVCNIQRERSNRASAFIQTLFADAKDRTISLDRNHEIQPKKYGASLEYRVRYCMGDHRLP